MANNPDPNQSGQTAAQAAPPRPSSTSSLAAPGRRLSAFSIAGCLVLFVVAAGWNSWKRDFWFSEEPRFAEAARAMERSGDWVVPKLGGSPYLDLPPLAYWLSAGAHALAGGEIRLVYRLPFLAAAALGLFITYVLGCKLFDPRIAFVGAAVQASTYGYFASSSWLDDDLLFAVCVQLAVTGFALSTRRGQPPGWSLLGWIGLAGCALSKSALLGLVLVTITLVPFLFYEAGLGGISRGFRTALRPPGPILFLVLAVPWYAAISMREGISFLDAHFLGQHLKRLVSSPYDAAPPYYYFVAVALGFLPWTLFAPLGLLHGKDRWKRDGERLCSFWSMSNFIALSFVSAKKPGYILVVWPPLSLLVSAALAETREWYSLWEGYFRRGGFRVVPVLMKVPLFLVAILGVSYFGGSFAKLLEDLGAPADRSAVSWPLALAALTSALAFAMVSRVRRLAAQNAFPEAGLEFACASLLILFGTTFFHEFRNAAHSSRAVLEKFASEIPPGSPVAVYGVKAPEVFYYLDRTPSCIHIDYPETCNAEDPRFQRIQRFLEDDRAAFLVTSRKELKLLDQCISLRPFLLERAHGRSPHGGEYVLVWNGKSP